MSTVHEQKTFWNIERLLEQWIMISFFIIEKILGLAMPKLSKTLTFICPDLFADLELFLNYEW